MSIKVEKLEENKKRKKPSEEMAWTQFHPEIAKNMVYPEIPCWDLIKEENRKRKDNIAISYNDTRICYGQLIDNVEELSENLRTKFDPYTIATIPTIPTPDLITLFYALSDNRVISDMIDPRTSLTGIKQNLEQYKKSEESHYLFTLDLFNKKMNDLLNDSSIEQIVNMSLSDHSTKMPLLINAISRLKGLERKHKFPENMTFSDFINQTGEKKNPKITEFSQETPLTIMRTGGTTGVPKGVLLSHFGLNATSWNIIHSGVDLQPKDKYLLYMPLFIAYGLIMVNVSLIKGMQICLVSPFNPKKMDKELFKHRAQHFAGVPSHIETLKNSKLVKKEGLSFLKTPTIGGDGISPTLHKEFSEFLLANGSQYGICPGYSLTEANSTGTINLGQLNKYGSAGYPLPGIKIGIFDEDYNELDYDQTGEVCVLTPSKMLGYHNNPEETANVLKQHKDGELWIHTGDLGKIDRDGFIHIIGRMKNMIIRHDGFKVFPKMIEEAIGSHQLVEACKVVGVRNYNYQQGEEPKAHIILKDGAKPTTHLLHEIEKICIDKLPDYMQPVDYKFRDSFPLTLIGKVDLIALKNEEPIPEKEVGMSLKKRK